jgi:RNA polymerase sigma factor (sigma-70 family)
MTVTETPHPREMFESNLPLIQGVLQKLSRIRRLDPDEREDFCSYAWLRMVQNDYAILASFQGRSSLQTFLVTVASRLLLDYRNQKWGKWRPSAQSQRLGSVAIRLETLIHRDGLSSEEAVERLVRQRDSLPRAELAAIAGRLPCRVRQRWEGEEVLLILAASECADELVVAEERRDAARQTRVALCQALASLPSEDRRVLRMRYFEGMTVRQIATQLNLEARCLYKRIAKCLRGLRVAMEAQEIDRRAGC